MDLMDPFHGLLPTRQFSDPATYMRQISALQQAQQQAQQAQQGQADLSPPPPSLQRLYAGGPVPDLCEEPELEGSQGSSGKNSEPDREKEPAVAPRLDTFDMSMDLPSFAGGRQVTEYQWPDQKWPDAWGPRPSELIKKPCGVGAGVEATANMLQPYQMTPGDIATMQRPLLTQNQQVQQDPRKASAAAGHLDQQKVLRPSDLGFDMGGLELQQKESMGGYMPMGGDPKLAAAALQAAQRAPGGKSDEFGMPTAEWQNTTTVMVRNLPNKYSQSLLLEELNNAGFAGTYDFLYLPIDPETTANRGYAFINFIDNSFAWMLRMTYEGQKMGRFNSDKVVSVVPAALQGFEANYSHYSTARVNRGPPETRPLFLRQSQNTQATQGQRRRGGRRSQASLVDQAARNQLRSQREATAGPASGSQQKSVYYIGIQGSSVSGAPSVARKTGPDDQYQADQLPKQEMVRFCHSCGGKAQPEFRFCQFCGSGLHLEEAHMPGPAAWGS